MEKAYRTSTYLFAAVLLMVVVGFYKTYFSLIPHFSGISTALHLHAITVLLWFGILIVQPLLVRGKNLALHRLIGKGSYIVVTLVVLSIVWLERLAFIRNTPVPPGAVDIRLIGIADLSFFILFYGLAIYYRRKVSYHARFMVLTVLPFINPALGRLGLPGPILALLIMIGLLIYERFNNRIYRPYLIGLIAYLAIYIFFLFVINADQWRAFWWMFF
ncbi:hypothetical protein [Spirosoma validum]|uniref:Uncharacterized protein n=1 Tax=Spirosoma validum TaxID=2771355 RepID=A0A927B6U7_9BACT|nr:hypothetical protein [Spirosoma validum]MBD2756348.1 hypothetical protein [Spirosoma validum]